MKAQMPAISAARPLARSTTESLRDVSLPALLSWLLGFALVAYLAFSNGGYDPIVRSEVGIALWWLVLIGVVVGILPVRLPVIGWVAVGLLAAFALWTVLSTGWSESAERSWNDA